jgi:glutamate formiminotransferase/formiminotetrahydrofolate cyclodeaminase
MLEDDKNCPLINMTLKDFANETASESPAPGGGSISAYVGALGVSLGTMVANLSSHKRGWDERWEEFSDWAVKGQQYKDQLLALVDEDTNAFNKIMDAFKMPKSTEEEKQKRSQAIEEATKYAIEVPFKVMETAYKSIEVMEAMIDFGMQTSLSDSAVGVLCAKTAVMGAFLNVKINAKDLKDRAFAEKMIARGNEIQQKTIELEQKLLKKVNEKL